MREGIVAIRKLESCFIDKLPERLACQERRGMAVEFPHVLMRLGASGARLPLRHVGRRIDEDMHESGSLQLKALSVADKIARPSG
jgi:hypothetical protein